MVMLVSVGAAGGGELGPDGDPFDPPLHPVAARHRMTTASAAMQMPLSF
jgi:hypothetical protein